jgi:hypothetical protein
MGRRIALNDSVCPAEFVHPLVEILPLLSDVPAWPGMQISVHCLFRSVFKRAISRNRRSVSTEKNSCLKRLKAWNIRMA